MRNKKLLSTVVTSALVATTMAMPVMAADTGSVHVDFTTKSPVIRVTVPTTILAAVDPLEMNVSGTQIHSSDFNLKNQSEVPVGIDVKSVVTLDTGVDLLDTKKAAEDSTDATKYEAWMAVAAETSGGKYIETANKTAGDLTETDKNVVTFKTVTASGGSESSASQTFYLDKAASSTATHTVIAPKAANAAAGKDAAGYKKSLTYAQVHEIEEDTTLTDTAKLLAKLQTEDVYEGNDASPADGSTLTLFPAGKTDAVFTTGKHYFTVKNANQLNSITDDKIYVYGQSADGENISFRYIGKLGSGKKDWSKAQIKEMDITYNIYGLTGEDYTAAPKQYGLYLAGPQVSITTSGVISITGLDGTLYQSMSLSDGTDEWPLSSSDGTWDWDEAESGKKELTLGDNWMSFIAGKTITVKVTLTNGTITSTPVTFP